MIKIKIKNKNLNEVEMKHSSTALKNIYDLYLKNSKDNRKIINQVIDIPLREIIQNSKQSKNGLPLFMTGYNDKQFSELKSSWNFETKTFSDEVINSFLDSKLSILYVHYNAGNSSPGSVDIGGRGTQQLFRLSFNVSKMGQNNIYRVIRHELQHITDKVNSICRKYYQELVKTNNLQNIKKIDLTQFIKPSDSIQSKSKIHMDVQDIKDRESFLRYLHHDEEYKTWLSDSLDTIIEWIFSSGDARKYLLQVKYKDMLQDANLAKRKQINDLASQQGINLSNIYTSDDMANYYVKTIFTNPKIMDDIIRINKNFKDFIEEMDNVRLKYIRKDLTLGLSKRLKQLSQKV